MLWMQKQKVVPDKFDKSNCSILFKRYPHFAYD